MIQEDLMNCSAQGISDVTPFNGDLQEELIQSSIRILSDLGIEHGPTHITMELVDGQLNFLGLARSIDPGFNINVHSECLTIDQIKLTVYAYLCPDLFFGETAERYQIYKSFIRIQIATEPTSILMNNRFTEVVTQLGSFRNFGTSLLNHSVIPKELWLVNEEPQNLLDDFQRVINRLPDGSVTSSNMSATTYVIDSHGRQMPQIQSTDTQVRMYT